MNRGAFSTEVCRGDTVLIELQTSLSGALIWLASPWYPRKFTEARQQVVSDYKYLLRPQTRFPAGKFCIANRLSPTDNQMQSCNEGVVWARLNWISGTSARAPRYSVADEQASCSISGQPFTPTHIFIAARCFIFKACPTIFNCYLFLKDFAQGSTLGVLSFLNYTSEAPCDIPGDIDLYTNDANICVTEARPLQWEIDHANLINRLDSAGKRHILIGCVGVGLISFTYLICFPWIQEIKLSHFPIQKLARHSRKAFKRGPRKNPLKPPHIW